MPTSVHVLDTQLDVLRLLVFDVGLALADPRSAAHALQLDVLDGAKVGEDLQDMLLLDVARQLGDVDAGGARRRRGLLALAWRSAGARAGAAATASAVGAGPRRASKLVSRLAWCCILCGKTSVREKRKSAFKKK